MALLRFVALVALALWVGGLAALSAVSAPALFDVLQAQDPATGRELAGRLFGVMFDRFQYIAWALGGIVIVSLVIRAALGPRPRRFGIRTWGATVMVAASLVTVFVVTPRIDAIRASVTGPVASLPADDGRRTNFGRLHGLSTGLMAATMLMGIGLLWMETRDHS